MKLSKAPELSISKAVLSPRSFLGGGYEIFAGKEVARALAIMSVKAEDCTDDLQNVTEKQLGTLKEWEAKFNVKYPVVGEVPPTPHLTLTTSPVIRLRLARQQVRTSACPPSPSSPTHSPNPHPSPSCKTIEDCQSACICLTRRET
jgi:hypothetical protein